MGLAVKIVSIIAIMTILAGCADPGNLAAILFGDDTVPGCIVGRIVGSYLFHAKECSITNLRSLTQEGNALQILTIIERKITNSGNCSRNGDILQKQAAVKRLLTNGFDGCRDRNIRKWKKRFASVGSTAYIS